MERVLWLVLLGGSLLAGVIGESNAIPGSSRGISSGDELVAAVIDSCFDGEDSFSRCVKVHSLSYLDHLTGAERGRSLEDEEARSEDDGRLDELVLDRVQRFLKTHELKVQLPEFFQDALLTIKPAHGLGDFDVTFPPAPEGESRTYSEGNSTRDMMKEKMLLPLLLLLKLKLKALTPILLFFVKLKAMKALFLSKLSILLVLGFLASQLFKKAGMMPMMPPMTMEMVTPPPYGPPGGPAPPVTMSSYEPAWEPNQGGPYQRVWEPQQVVYSGYLGNQQPQNTQQTAGTPV